MNRIYSSVRACWMRGLTVAGILSLASLLASLPCESQEPSITLNAKPTTPDATKPIRWPLFEELVANQQPSLVASDRPRYLHWQNDAASRRLAEGGLQTEVTRVSDADAFGIAGHGMCHQYAKVSPWNADDSLAMLFVTGTSKAVLLDGQTYKFIRVMPNTYTGGRWSMKDPHIFFQIALDWSAKLHATDVRTGESTVRKDFIPLGYLEQARTSMFGGEGNQSVDDRYWVFQLRHRARGWQLVIWDAVNDRITGAISLPETAGPGHNVDYWAVSPNGNFILTVTQKPWNSDLTRVPSGINVWSRDGQYLRNVPQTAGGHVDYGIDVDGHEVAVFIGTKYGNNDKTCQSWRLDGASGNRTVDQFADGIVGWNFHISCAATSKPGYAVVSTFPSEQPNSYNVFPMWNHAFAVRLDGSGRIGVIAQVHHAETAESNDLYLRSSFAVPNRQLSAVWFTACWDSADGPIHSFVARPSIESPK